MHSRSGNCTPAIARTDFNYFFTYEPQDPRGLQSELTWGIIAMSPESKKGWASDTQSAFLFAHKSNIEKYKKILQTDLTDLERLFVRRRLAEEQAALHQLARVAEQV